MTYAEQFEWLRSNGFEQPWSAQQNMIIWHKELTNLRRISFTWLNSIPRWEIYLKQWDLDGFVCEQIWIADAENEADFTRFQPLIDIIQ